MRLERKGLSSVIYFHSLISKHYTWRIKTEYRYYSATVSNMSTNGVQLSQRKSNLEMGDEKVTPKIGTHSGTFHCDEVLACYMLKQLPEYKDASILRTRDPSLLDGCDIVVDVGGVFDPATNRFDHHQRTFSDTMNTLNPKMKWTTKLSSAGLIYYHFGEDVLKQIVAQPLNAETLKVVYDKMYDNFIEEVDAVDNGIDQYDGEPKYRVSTTLGARVSRLNPGWNDENRKEEESFNKALSMVGEEFKSRVLGIIRHWLPARSLVEEAIARRYEVDSSGEILQLEHFCPWKDHLFTLEREKEIEPQIKYVIYADTSGNWRVQCVPAGSNTFDNRLSLYSKWRGLRDAKLSEESGIPGCIFVHASGFIGGNATRDGALNMAIKSIKLQAECG